MTDPVAEPLTALRAALMSRVNDGFCKYDASIVTEVLDQFATLDTARDAVPDSCSTCGIPIAEHPDSDACAILDQRRDTIREAYNAGYRAATLDTARDAIPERLARIERTAMQLVDEVGVHWYRAADVRAALTSKDSPSAAYDRAERLPATLTGRKAT